MPDPKESQQELMKEIFKDRDNVDIIEQQKRLFEEMQNRGSSFFSDEEQLKPTLLVCPGNHVVAGSVLMPIKEGQVLNISIKVIDSLTKSFKELSRVISGLKFDDLARRIESFKSDVAVFKESIPTGDRLSLVPRFGVENKNHPFCFESIHSKKPLRDRGINKIPHRKCFMQLKTNQNLRF